MAEDTPDAHDAFQELSDRARCGLLGYFVAITISTGVCSAITIILWSLMGIGKDALKELQDAYEWYSYPIGLSFLIMFVLYLLDAFWPPHLHGQLFVFFDKDRFVAKGVILFCFILFIIGCFLMAKWYPNVPMLTTIFVIPISTGLVRVALRPAIKVERSSAILTDADLNVKMKTLANLTGIEQDQMNFFKGTFLAYATVSIAAAIIWLVWMLQEDRLKPMEKLDGKMEKEVYFNQFACPIVVAISNLVFALFCAVRIFMQQTYLATDTFRNQLVVEAASTYGIAGKRPSLAKDMEFHGELLKKARLSQGADTPVNADDIEEMKSRYGEATEKSMRQLSFFVKVTGCAFMVLLGMLYVGTQLLYADSSIASMVMGLMGAFFLIFVVFVYVAFKRLVEAMGKWVADLPMWQSAGKLIKSEWTIALLLCVSLPWIPFVLLLSAVNQLIRKSRGIAQLAVLDTKAWIDGGDSDAKPKEEPPAPESLCITPRIWVMWDVVKKSDYLSVIFKCILFSFVYFLYTIVPLLLNVVLAWLIPKLADNFSFGLILVMTFLVGVVAFLLPPVPGMTVYIFGGLILSDDKVCPAGFVAGCFINIALCWFLKLAACAVQQKCIGELLGTSTWVRQTVGVHRVGIRCIEAEMRKPGWSLGKVAILCGGPDWPVSVLAGVLKLSLVQCEIGTIPIIFFVAPCALTGSFYLKKGETEIWTRLANMMIVTSVVVNLILWALAAWAIQGQLEKNFKELTRPLAKYVDLEWLDYKAEQVVKRSTITWSDVPTPVQVLYALGCYIHIMVAQGLFWGYNYLFGKFQVNDGIDNLTFYGKDGLFKFYSVVALGVYSAAWILPIVYSCWKSAKVSGPRKAIAKEMDRQEASWKEKFLAEIEDRDNEKSVEDTPEVSDPAPVQPEPVKEPLPVIEAVEDKPKQPELDDEPAVTIAKEEQATEPPEKLPEAKEVARVTPRRSKEDSQSPQELVGRELNNPCFYCCVTEGGKKAEIL